MSFASALSTTDSLATSGAGAVDAGRGQELQHVMAKSASKKSAPTTDTAATKPVVNTPQTPGAVLDAAVRKAERAFLTAVDGGGDGAVERAALKDAKAARATFLANRLPIAARSFVFLMDSTSDDMNSAEAQAAITELRSALSGLAKPVAVAPAAPATE